MSKFILKTEQQRNGFIEYLKNLNLNKSYIVTINKVSQKRNLSQNGIYWAWLNFLEKETGNAKEDLHYYFAKRYLGTEPIKIKLDKNYASDRVKSTTSLSEAKFAEYLEKIKQEMSDFGIVLLSINSPLWPEFYAKYKV